ncbi:MAG: VOC family protein [Myxococcales bacterium]|nr:MAG: VOC family protein [Myxococcales bacterium]
METSNRVLDALLKEFELPHVEERVPRDVFYQLGLKFPQQYAIAARDVAACVKRAEAVGAGPFLHVTIPAPNWVERGELLKDCKLEVALGYAGDRQVEFLGPGEGTKHYARELVDADYVFHHVGIYQNGMSEIAPRLEAAGHPEVVRGGIKLGSALSFDFRYFDSREALGIYLEIQDFTYFSRELSIEPFLRGFAKIKTALPI